MAPFVHQYSALHPVMIYREVRSKSPQHSSRTTFTKSIFHSILLFLRSLSTTSNSSLTNTPNTHFQNAPFFCREFYELYPIKIAWNDFTTDCTIFTNLAPDWSGTIQSFQAPKMCESQRHQRIAQCPIGKILSNPVHLRSPRQPDPASE